MQVYFPTPNNKRQILLILSVPIVGHCRLAFGVDLCLLDMVVPWQLQHTFVILEHFIFSFTKFLILKTFGENLSISENNIISDELAKVLE